MARLCHDTKYFASFSVIAHLFAPFAQNSPTCVSSSIFVVVHRHVLLHHEFFSFDHCHQGFTGTDGPVKIESYFREASFQQSTTSVTFSSAVEAADEMKYCAQRRPTQHQTKKPQRTHQNQHQAHRRWKKPQSGLRVAKHSTHEAQAWLHTMCSHLALVFHSGQ